MRRLGGRAIGETLIRPQRTLDALEAGMAAGLHPGAQLYASVGGRPVVDLAVGSARPDQAMTPSTVMPYFCSGKPLAAIAVGQLWQSGDLGIDDPVCRYVEDFGAGGKEAVTVRHLLTHTAGWIGDPAGRALFASREAIVALINEYEHEDPSMVGRRARYNVWSSWYLLAEVIERVCRRPYPDVIRDRILAPLGLDDVWVTMSARDFERTRSRLGTVYETKAGRLRPNSFTCAKEACMRVVPPLGARGPMSQLGRLYEHLVARDGYPVLGRGMVSAMTSHQRVGLVDPVAIDGADDVVVDWGLGFAVESRNNGPASTYFSRHASFRSFGHCGLQSSVAFADPEAELVVAMVTNGMPDPIQHRARQLQLLDAVYEDLGLGR